MKQNYFINNVQEKKNFPNNELSERVAISHTQDATLVNSALNYIFLKI